MNKHTAKENYLSYFKSMEIQNLIIIKIIIIKLNEANIGRSFKDFLKYI